MTTPALSKTFEERMFEQIKSQMGDLMTADELKAILETSIQKAFFEPRQSGGGYQARQLEPLFVEMIRKELTPLLEAGAKQWMTENQEKVGKILKEQMGENAAQMVANAFSSLMFQPMQNFAFELQNKLSAQNVHI